MSQGSSSKQVNTIGNKPTTITATSSSGNNTSGKQIASSSGANNSNNPNGHIVPGVNNHNSGGIVPNLSDFQNGLYGNVRYPLKIRRAVCADLVYLYFL